MKRKVLLAVTAFLLLTVMATSVAYINKNAKATADQQQKLQNSRTELIKVNNTLEKVKQEKVEDKDSAQQQIQKLEQEKKDLQDQLQAKVEQKAKLAAAQVAVEQAPPVVAAATLPVVPSTISSGCGDNTYANYIYMHESTCNLTVTNAEGCIGIGQACPAEKLTAVCPNLDYACENQFFTDYAISRYGSWEGAYNTWLSQHWW
jgi:TolA-binding protein